MINGNQEKSIKNKVLEAIKSGQVKMRPRWYFILKTILVALGIVMIFLTLLYLISFIIFILRITGIWFAPAFGFEGYGIFLFSLPWLLVIISVLFAIILEVLVKRYSFAYRHRLYENLHC